MTNEEIVERNNNLSILMVGIPTIDNYHEDWNLLHEVVEFIEEIGSYYICGTKCYQYVEMSNSHVKFYYQKDQNYLLQYELKRFIPDKDDVWRHPMFKEHMIKQFDFKNRGLKEAVFTAVSDFAKWYITKSL